MNTNRESTEVMSGEAKMRKRIINIALVLAVVALMVFLAFHVKIKRPVQEVAVLKTIGMTCGSCAGKIEKALMRLPGTAGVEVDVEGGWVLVGYQSTSAKPDTFAAAVNNEGFRSWLMEKMPIAEFKKVAGRDFGSKAVKSSYCGNGGCGSNRN
ncbi:heavy metal transport/detoxification domain protein [Geotalea daltonii FRC-32]|uniref:Heavy metal transport/detoxification domain protein n=2 Tax=Geotalea TaxID=2910589 RepID=B9M0Q0_GEODF|nr:heavy metal transport/detoxification domain protein [Geotalea daltonii FRC-32]